MTGKIFTQHGIGLHPPQDWSSQNQTIMQLYLRETGDLNITYFSNTTLPGENRQYTTELDFAIWHDFVIVEIYLTEITNNIEWRWSTSLDAFTTKNADRREFYSDLHYKENADSRNWVKAKDWIDEKGNYKPSKAISFKAKKQKKESSENHPFSLNIEIKQKNGKWLPVTIDPDVRNPPPIPNDDRIINPTKQKMNYKDLTDKGTEFHLFDHSI